MIRFLALAAAAFSLTSAAARAESLGFSLSDAAAAGALPDDLSIRVLDDATLKPVGQAEISIGDTLLSDPATRGLSGDDGGFIAHSELTHGARALTVSRAGYATVSITGLRSRQVTVSLKAVGATDTVTASGEMPAWPGLGDGDNIDAGVVFESLSALDLLNFTTASFISPLKDTIDVFGSHQIPSNFLIPDQDVPVLFAHIHVSKPGYRLPLARGKLTRLAGLQGSVTVSDAVSLAQGGKLSLELLNKLTFTHAGISDPLVASQDLAVPVDASVALAPQHTVTPGAPPFAADVLVAALTDLNGDRSVLLPTDIKLASDPQDPSQLHAATVAAPDASVGHAHDVLTVAMADKGRRVSGIITEGAGSSVDPGSYLPVDELQDSPTLPDTVTLTPVPTGVAAAVYEVQGRAVWYAFALPGAQATQVPSRRLPAPAGVTSYSVLGFDFGAGFDARTLDGQAVMQRLERFTRASAKIAPPTPFGWDFAGVALP